MEAPQNSSNLLNIPMAIVIAGAIIAGTILYTKSPSNYKPADNTDASFEENMRAVSSADHIFGNPNARLKIVEYSDTSCPFCKDFHHTMNRIMEEYGSAGNIAWVYRHYPLDKEGADGTILHPNANREAQALECADSLGGNEKFWKYTHRLYDITPSVTLATPRGLDQKELPKIAEYAGLNVSDFNNCLSTGKFKEKVDADFLDGINIGIQSTPSSVIVLEKAFPASIKEKLMKIYEPFKDPSSGEYPIQLSTDSKKVMIIGGMPFEIIKTTIDLFFTY